MCVYLERLVCLHPGGTETRQRRLRVVWSRCICELVIPTQSRQPLRLDAGSERLRENAALGVGATVRDLALPIEHPEQLIDDRGVDAVQPFLQYRSVTLTVQHPA